MKYFETFWNLINICNLEQDNSFLIMLKMSFLDDCYAVSRNEKINPDYILLILSSGFQYYLLGNIVNTISRHLMKGSEDGIWIDLYKKPATTQR